MVISDLAWIFLLVGVGFAAVGVVLARMMRRPSLATAGLTVATLGLLGNMVISAITATSVLQWVFVAITAGLFAYIVKKLIEMFRARKRKTSTEQ